MTKDVNPNRKRPAHNSVEVKNPDAAAQVILAMAEVDGKKLDKAIKNAGLPDRTAEALRARARELYPEVICVLEDLSKESFVKALQELRKAVLEAITPEKIENSSAAQLSIIYATMQDKQALLEGDPTSIVSIEDRRNLDELMGALVKEGQRRGILIEAKPEDEAGEDGPCLLN